MAIYKTQVLWLLFSTVVLHDSFAQITYFDQDFSGGGPYASPSPDIGQFTDLKASETAYFGNQNGVLQMVKADASMGGSLRAVRATPFVPTPQTLYIQMTLSAEEITGNATNAFYFYVGENFDPQGFGLPNNALLFSKISLNFTGNAIAVHDIETGASSPSIPVGKSVTITWVLNNSGSSVPYKFPETAPVANHTLQSSHYDVWVDGNLLVNEAPAYPLPTNGSNPYSATKLSNFELRFRSGAGKINIDKLLIRDIDGVLPVRFRSFDAKLVNDKVDLFWETELEQEVSHYIVERSTDNINFTKIGELPAAGNQSNNAYAYRDEYPCPGNSYYRISERDRFGKAGIASNSKDIIYYDSGQKAFVYPNPGRAGVVRLKGLHKNFQNYRLFNLMGQEIPHQGRKLSEYEMDIYPVVPLRPGLYFISYHKGLETETIKIAVSE